MSSVVSKSLIVSSCSFIRGAHSSRFDCIPKTNPVMANVVELIVIGNNCDGHYTIWFLSKYIQNYVIDKNFSVHRLGTTRLDV